LQVKTQKTHCNPASRRESKGMALPYPPGRWGLYRMIRGSLRRHKCNVRRNSTMAKSSYISFEWSLLSKGLRGGKSRRLRVESLLRHMLQSVRGKSATKKSLCKKSIVGGKAPTPKGFNRGPAAARWCNVRRIRFQVSPVYIG